MSWKVPSTTYPTWWRTHTNDKVAKNKLNGTYHNNFEELIDQNWWLHAKISSSLSVGSTIDLNDATGGFVPITGNSTAVTSFGSNAPTGIKFKLNFTGTGNRLTYNATSMIIPGDANLYIDQGDVITVIHSGSGNWEVIGVMRADGMPLGRRGVANGSADDGVWEIDTDQSLSTANDRLIHAKNNGSSRWAIEYQGYEYVSNAGNGGVGILERVLRNYARSERISTYDFYSGVDITIDGYWHDIDSGSPGDERLDCSSFIPTGTKTVTLHVQWRSTVAGQYIQITGEENPSSNTTYNTLQATNPEANMYGFAIGTITLPDDDSRKLSYFANAQGNNARITALKWGL